MGVAVATALVTGAWTGPDRVELSPDESRITLLGTNDIHGGLDPVRGRDGAWSGGMAEWAGAAMAIREGLARQLGERSGVLIVDAGDQFQGSLLSNFNEGRLVFEALSSIGYAAVVPGNHDYDFGPEGWLDDKVTPGLPDSDPRGVIRKLARNAAFPLLSANTYLKASLKAPDGAPVDVQSRGCLPPEGQAVAWSGAQRPDFLQPYVIRNAAGVRVAFIGLDNPDTGTTTTPENVSDFCFRDELESYLEVRQELQGRADLFVMVIHNGAPVSETLAQKLLERGPDQVHAIFAGHTHRVEKALVGGQIPVLQSGSGGEQFGRVDLVFDRVTHKLNLAKTQALAGARIQLAACADSIRSFCELKPADPQDPAPRAWYEGQLVQKDAAIEALIAGARKELAPMASRRLGHAVAPITRERIFESALANALTDAFREVSGAEIALMNTGGIRADLDAGDVTYEDLFRVLPFNNHGVVIDALEADRLLRLLTASITTCGGSGSLMQSGLRVKYERDCKGNRPVAKLLHVETVQAEVIYDLARNVAPAPGRTFRVATLDFLAAGGSGYSDFIGAPVALDLGIVREVLTRQLLEHPVEFSPQLDGRWRGWFPAPAPGPVPMPPPVPPTPPQSGSSSASTSRSS